MDKVVLAVTTLYYLIMIINYFITVSGNAEVEAFSAFKNSLTSSTNAMDSWDSAADTPCTWFHVTCNGDQKVTRIDLGTASLSGQIVSQVGQLTSLQYLELYGNNISGEIPHELGNLSSLVSLDLYQNNLTGPIPGTLSSLSKLQFLRLNNNKLKGEIPVSLVTISNLRILDFSYNQLRGDIPVNGSFSIFTPVSFRGNPQLKNVPVPPPVLNNTSPSSSPAIHNTGAIAGGVAVAAALLFTGPAIAIAWWLRRKPQDHYFDVPAEEVTKVHLRLLKRFALGELQIATDNFSMKNILGRGGFGKVYKGRLADGSLVAVKRLKEERSQGGELQFQTEVEIISMAVHSNLLRLQGFCMTPTERLLVYPFMVNGSVASCLRVEHPETQPALNWEIRKQIAVGAARGLAYLHEDCVPKIIHRDVKAANILLDKDFKAVVGDFGLAKLMDYGDTHVTTAVRGTIGHIPPEYLSTGKSSEKTDVFGFGIMLLELITGQRAFDLARMANDEEVMLLDWVKNHLYENKMDMLVDVNLQVNYDEREVKEVIQIAILCTNGTPMDRPKMSEVVQMLEGDGLAERWGKWQNHEIIQPQTDHFNLFKVPFTVVDSTSNICPDELSGPR